MTVSAFAAPQNRRRWAMTTLLDAGRRALPPRIGTTLGTGIGVLASLAPGLLPVRPARKAC